MMRPGTFIITKALTDSLAGQAADRIQSPRHHPQLFIPLFIRPERRSTYMVVRVPMSALEHRESPSSLPQTESHGQPRECKLLLAAVGHGILEEHFS